MSQVITANRTSGSKQAGPPSTAIVVHALHKSASMFLHELFQELAIRTDTPYFSIHNPNKTRRLAPPDRQESFIQCPIRSFDLDISRFATDRQTHVCQIRDPRDILVSQYFSLGWIHTENNWSQTEKNLRRKVQAMTIDQYVLQEAEISNVSLLERYRPLLKFRNNVNCTIVRYEDMVLHLRQWLKPIVGLFRFRIPWLINYQLRKKFSAQFKVANEQMQHRRRITPGDHLEKLQPETIQELNLQFAEILRTFNYST